MAQVDHWPSTPMKLILGWVAFLGMLVFSLAAMWLNKPMNGEFFVTVWTAVLAYNGIALGQFWVKRATAWEPPTEPTKSEVAKGAESGQPTVAAVAPPRPRTSAEAEEEE